MRRTTSIDIARPDGLLGRIVADIRGQDVRTDADGVGHVVHRLSAVLEIDQRNSQVVAVSEAAARELGWLVGVNVRSGFGRRLAATMPGERDRRSLLYSVLEDLSGALLVSGYSLLRGGLIQPSRERGEQMADAQADVCIGWASGSPLVEGLRHNGISAVPMGPAAPVIEGDDPLGWHPMAPLAPGTVRRRRRLDVIPPASDDEPVLARSHFRDSYAGDDGETVMHEYLVDAQVDDQRQIARVEVAPRVLPWTECPGAVASAQRVVGTTIDEIPARVRAELTGPSTCTHLNSTLRSLADLPAVAENL